MWAYTTLMRRAKPPREASSQGLPARGERRCGFGCKGKRMK